MAEVGIIASVLGIATAGCKVTKGLYEIADAIGSAGEEVRLVALDTEAFSQMLYNLGEVLKTILGSPSPSRLIITTEDILKICEQILQPFKKILARLNPLLERFKGSERKLSQVGLRIQWIFRHKSKLLFYHKMLNSLKSTLACLLATLNLQCSSNMDATRGEILRMQLENATSAVNHILEHTSSIQLLENNYREQLNRRLTSAGTDVVAEYSDVDDSPGQRDLSELRPGRSQFDVARGRAPNTDTSSEDASFGEILDREIDEDLDGDLRGASGRKALALYEDIRASQRQVLKLKDEMATSTFTHTAEQDVELLNTTDPLMANTRNNMRLSAIEVSSRVFEPYTSQRHKGISDPGKSLRDLRHSGQVLFEDTKGTFYYLPLQISKNWMNLKRFIRDLYSYGPPAHLNYPSSGPLASAVMVNGVQFSRTPEIVFKNEHGVMMRGDKNAYKKMAFKRAIDEDEYHIEDPSGNSDHLGAKFRRDNWDQRTWLNAHLVMRFDNDYFNDLGKQENYDW